MPEIVVLGKSTSTTSTPYKQALLERLTQAFAEHRMERGGAVELVNPLEGASTVLDMVFEGDWRGTLNATHFSATPA